MESKKINQLATNVNPQTSDLTTIGDPITGQLKKITWLQVAHLIGAQASVTLQQVTDNGNTTTDPITTGGLTLTNIGTGVVRSTNGEVVGTYGYGLANGVATLDSGGKIPAAQLPSSVMEYKGTWNASTNTPTLADGTGDNGDVYLVNVAGSQNLGSGTISFAVGDWVVYNGTIWQKSLNSNAVASVFGRTGTITAQEGDYNIDQLGDVAITSAAANDYLRYTGSSWVNTPFPALLSSDKLVLAVRNNSGATINKGTVVYINGATAGYPTIAKALATGDSTSAQTMGVVQDNISNNANGYVVAFGQITGIDTSAYTAGTQLYLSSTTAGAFTSTKQYAPNHLVYVGVVTTQNAVNGVIEVRVQNGYELDEIHDVSAQNPSNNDGIFYNTTTSLWEKKSIATVLGYTPEQPLTFSAPLSRSTNTVSIPVATSSANGYLSSTDWATFNNKLTSPMTTLGDIIYGGASGAATRLAGNTTTTKQYLSQTGNGTVSAAPAWATISGSDITGAALTKTDDTNVTLTLGGTPATALLRAASLTLGWTGQLAISRGGTGASTKAAAFDALSPMTTLGDVVYGGASGTGTRLAGNTTTTKQYLSQTGTGTVSAAPSWATISGTDITGAALTETDDTNVTLTLGGTPSTALLRAVSLTLGWTGQLSVARGGTGAASFTAGQILYGNGTSAISTSATFTYTPTSALLVNNSVTAATAIARGINFTPTLVAAANNDVLIGVDVAPSYTNGAFTGVSNIGLRINGSVAAANNYDALILRNASDGGIKVTFTNSVAAELASITAGVAGTGAGTDDGVLLFRTSSNAVAADRMSINATGTVRLNAYTTNGLLYVSGGTGTISSAARTINGTTFDGSANITITANTTNAVTFNNGGAGAASGTTFDGSAARTISHNTIGALALTGGTLTGALSGTTASFTINSNASVIGVLSRNTSAGTAAVTGFALGNDASANAGGIALFGSLYTSATQYRANGTYVYSNLAGGLTLHAEGANSMYLATNGTVALTINSSQAATFSSVFAGYGMSITNVQDSAQGLLLRSSDNDTTLYLARFQSSVGATSTTWVDRFSIAKNGSTVIGDNAPFVNVRLFVKGEDQTAANYALNVADSLNQDIVWFRNDKVTRFFGEVGIGVVPTSGNRLWVKGNDSTSSNTSFIAQNSSNAFLLYVRNDANIGINNSDPVKTLDVRGTLAISNSAASYWYIDRDDSNGRFKILTDANADRFAITTGGDVYLNNAAALFFGPTSVTYIVGSTTSMSLYVDSGEKLKLTTTSVLAGNPSEGATGEGLIAGRSFKIDATGTGQTAKMYVVSNTLSDTYGSGLTAQFANFAGDKGFGFNLNTTGGFEIYLRNTTWNKAVTITNAGRVDVTQGVKFGSGATALNYYEEGTWTPVLRGTGTAGTFGYQYRSGSYARIGNQVFIRWGFKLNSVSGSPTGTMQITGLPFTSVTWSSYQEPGTAVSTGLLATADYAQRARVFVNNAATSMEGRIINNSDTPWDISQFSGDEWVIGELFYNVT